MPRLLDEFRRRIYVRLRYSWLSVRIVQPYSAPQQYESDTTVMVQTSSKGESKILGVGKQTSVFPGSGAGNVKLANAFDHPRTAIKNFELAHLTLKYFIEQACGKTSIFHAGLMVIHPQDRLEGGLSDIESRALIAMGLVAGAREAFVYNQPLELTDEQILNIDFRDKTINGASHFT